MEVVWRFEPRIFYISSLRVKLILAPIEFAKTVKHTRLRARDQRSSSTLIGGKGGTGPSSLHTTLE